MHEHPKGSSSWKEPEIKELEKDPRVYKVSGPMCHRRMMSEDDQVDTGYVRKETTWLTSSQEIANILQTSCGGTHRHVQLVGGRAAACARYPPKLVREILKALKKQLEKQCDEFATNSVVAGPTTEDTFSWKSNTWLGSSDPEEYWDDVNGGALFAAEVRNARAEELK